MTAAGDLHDRHADHGAVFEDRDGRRVVAHYGRPERAHLAVRNGAGVVASDRGVVVVEGTDRVDYVDDVVTASVPRSDGEGRYALLCDPGGAVETDMYVFNAGERLLLVLPADRAGPLAADWSEKVFLRDVTVRDASDEFAVFGVHGPVATEKVASVFSESVPEEPLSFARGAMHDAGVTVVVSDAPTGEEGYAVVAAAADATEVFDTLVTRGMSIPPFGRRTWETLTLEAGTPLLGTELAGRLPNVCGVHNGVDLDKGCFVGQEVISRVANRGRPSRRLVGLQPEHVPAPGAAVYAGEGTVGEVTRAAVSPSLDRPVALALVEFDHDADDLAVEADGERVPAPRTDLPFVAGSAESARLPRYD
jgi:aminomethyltransferase